MPLDFALWARSEAKALKGRKKKQTKKSYLARLKRVARNLDPADVKKCCASLRKRIQATIDARGQIERSD